MLNIYYEISDPVEKEGEDIIIDKRWIVKSVIGKRIYSQLSTQDGVNFFLIMHENRIGQFVQIDGI